MATKSTRMTFNLSEELVESLREMAERTGTTMTDALKRAIAVQEFLDEQQAEGKNVLLEDPENNTLRQLVLFNR
ncbi:hypothetical protein BH11ACT8_BH11ACT8_01860 [soil metagenome]